jgi:hypothetical protein
MVHRLKRLPPGLVILGLSIASWIVVIAAIVIVTWVIGSLLHLMAR